MSNYSSNKCLFSFSSISSSSKRGRTPKRLGPHSIFLSSKLQFVISKCSQFDPICHVSVDFPSMFLHFSPDFHVLSLEFSGPPAAHGLPTPLLPAPHGHHADTEARAAAVGRRGETTGSHERSVPWEVNCSWEFHGDGMGV